MSRDHFVVLRQLIPYFVDYFTKATNLYEDQGEGERVLMKIQTIPNFPTGMKLSTFLKSNNLGYLIKR